METTIKTITSKSGKEVVFRYPTMEDIDEYTRYINELSKEDTFITCSGEEITKDEETEYITRSLAQIEKGDKVIIGAYCDGNLIGITNVDRHTSSRKRELHIAGLGLSVAADFRGEGIGEALIRCAIDEAKNRMSGLKTIILKCFANNDKALHLYKKVGFKEFGRLPKGVLYKDEFVDYIEMYLEVS